MKCVMALAISMATLAIAGCTAPVPMAAPDANAAGKTFEAPPPGKSALYIFREGRFNAAYLLTAHVGQRTLGQLGADTWFRIDVEPGMQSLRCTTSESSEQLQLQLAPGDVRFVEIAARLGWMAPRCAIFEVSNEKGRTAVLGGQRAVPQ
jgi:hypothetical protein